MSYNACSTVSECAFSDSSPITPSILVPVGLHVDINNGKLFRHIMVLLYLTHDEHNDKFVDGATTFPLALPLKNEEQAGIFCPHASRLVDKKIYHIMKDAMTEDTAAIERSAVSLFHKYLTHPGESTKQSGQNQPMCPEDMVQRQ